MIRVFVDLGPKMAALLHQLAAQRAAPGFIARLLDAFPAARSPEPAPRQAGLIEPLSERELEVLALLAQRLSNKEIARELSISPMTVKRHTVNIYQKLLVSGRREAVAKAVALGILLPTAGLIALLCLLAVRSSVTGRFMNRPYGRYSCLDRIQAHRGLEGVQ